MEEQHERKREYIHRTKDTNDVRNCTMYHSDPNFDHQLYTDHQSYTNKDEVPSVGVISGTFAKYTTSATGSDSARVATWGVDKNNASITLDNLFSDTYDNVKGVDSDVIAPGTTGSANFEFKYSGKADAPEVAYTFKVDTEGSTISDDIKNNTNIVWSLDNEECTAADGKTDM